MSNETTPQTATPETSGDEQSLVNTEEAKTSPESAKPEDKKADDKSGAPEKYADYKLPEGTTMDPEFKARADAAFKGMNLTQEQAQSLVDMYVKETQEAFERPFKAYNEMKEKWRQDSLNHPDLRGKLGKGLEINTRIAKALSQLNDPALEDEFKQMMDLTAAGNHPAFIRVFYALAKQVTEGGHVSGAGPSKLGQSQSGQEPLPSAAKALYPNLPSNG